MSFLYSLANNKSNKSLSHKMRVKRFSLFLSLIKNLPKPLSILDVGGTIEFWESMNFKEEGVYITLLNLTNSEVSLTGIKSIAGDATNLINIGDQSFDIVFSNSVIEHLYTWENQKKMASEIQRVGKRYIIQTPNYWFPIEPHWVFPFFQFLPFQVRVLLTQHFSLGHIQKKTSRREAVEQVKEIRLLSEKEVKLLFPNATIFSEKFGGVTKSLIAYKF